VGKPQRELDPFRDELAILRKALGGRIRELRALHGWTQEEWAAQAHIHRTFSGAVERGEKNVSFHALVMIARSFGTTLSELLHGLEVGESANVPTRKGWRKRIEHDQALAELAKLQSSLSRLSELVRSRGQTEAAKRPKQRRPKRKQEGDR
jgi:transcriptional regulator with XRE-family HTH domain